MGKAVRKKAPSSNLFMSSLEEATITCSSDVMNIPVRVGSPGLYLLKIPWQGLGFIKFQTSLRIKLNTSQAKLPGISYFCSENN